MALELDITIKARTDPRFPLGYGELEELCQAIASTLGLEGALELVVVDDRAMARHNADFLGLSGPTNTLAFENPDPEILGQVILNAHAVARESFLYAQDRREHTVRLLAHAILHLAGYDHGEEMYSLTDMLVDSI